MPSSPAGVCYALIWIIYSINLLRTTNGRQKFVAPTGLGRVHKNSILLISAWKCVQLGPYIDIATGLLECEMTVVKSIFGEFYMSIIGVTEFILGVESGKNNCNACRINHTVPGVCGSLVSLQMNISITINDTF